MAKDKRNLKGGLDEREPGLANIRPKKGGKPKVAPVVPDAAVLAKAKADKRVADEAVAEIAAKVRTDMLEQAGLVAQVFFDGTQGDPATNFGPIQDWITTVLTGQEGKVGQTAWLAMYEATFGREMFSHQELDRLLKWLVSLKRLVCKGKAAKGRKPKKALPSGDLYHFGQNYNWPTEAGFTATQSRIAVSAFNKARDRIWEAVNKDWAEAPAKFKTRATVTLEQFMDGEPGRCYLDVPGYWKKDAWVEGGPLLVESDGQFVTVVDVANELGHKDRRNRKAMSWGNFERWMEINAIPHDASPGVDAFQGVEVPLHMIVHNAPSKDQFYEGDVFRRNQVCWRIRDGIRALVNPPKPRPAKAVVKTVAKPAAEPKPVKRVTKVRQPKSAKEMAGIASVRLGPKRDAKKRVKKDKSADDSAK